MSQRSSVLARVSLLVGIALIALSPLSAQFDNARRIQGTPVSPTPPANGNALCFDSGTGLWTPAACTNAGPKGATGPAGAAGATGASGTAGASGATGPAGATGATGVGITGPSGPSGPAGTACVPDVIAVTSGVTTSVIVGYNCTVPSINFATAQCTDSGSSPTPNKIIFPTDVIPTTTQLTINFTPSAVFNGTCSAVISGAQGATGPAGAPGGPTGATGATGPQGVQGATGPAGPSGTAGANGATGATGPAGATGAPGTGTPCVTTAGSLQYNNAGTFGCVTPFTFSGSTITGTSAALFDMSASSTTSAFKVPTAAGAIPTTDGILAYNSTLHGLVYGSNGSTAVSAVAGLGTTGSTSCTNQVFTTISGSAAPTCSPLVSTFLPLSAMGTITGGVWNGTIITGAFGGTGNGFLTFAGPATSGKTWTGPNASTTLLTTNAAVTAGQGGTGVANTATLTLGSSNQNWATLGTGIVKSTVTTGALSVAGSSDVIATWSGTCSSSTFLRGDGSCQTPAGSISGLTATAIVAGATSTTIATPSATSTLDSSGNMVLAGTLTSVGVNTGFSYSGTPGTAGLWVCGEGTAPTGQAGADIMYCDSTLHRVKVSNNNGSFVQLVQSGADINTSDQVTVTHLSSGLPINQGGSGTNTSITGILQGGVSNFSAATANNIASITWVAGGGSANVQTATYAPAVTSLQSGLQLCWLPVAANTTTTPTFAPNGLTAHTIVKAGGAVAASDLVTTKQACAVYNTTGTQWELQNPQTTSGGGGTVTTSGTPASGNLTFFSGGTAITNGDLTGDATTSGTSAVSVVKVNGGSLPTNGFVVKSSGAGQIINANANDLTNINWIAGGGTANAQSANMTVAVGSYVNGQTIIWKPSNSNTTTTPTLNVNSNGAVTIVGKNGAALVAGDIAANIQAVAIYNTTGAHFELQNPQVSGAAGTVTTTGSPASGNLTAFSGAASVTSTDLTGDATTSGTTAVTVLKSAALKSATTTVDVSAATAPVAGQVLTATNSTHATWQAAGGGGGTSGWSVLAATTFVGNATQYAPAVGGGLTSTTETVVSSAFPAAATISSLSVSINAALGAGATLTVTLEDGTATPSALTCATSSGGTTCVDNTHSVNVAKGDLLSFKLVAGGTVTSGLPQIMISYAVGTSGVGTTSVSFTGGLISVASATTTPALTVAGTSGGIPYFSSASTWASSAALASGQFVLGGGAGSSPTASFSVVPNTKGGTGADSSAATGVAHVASGTWSYANVATGDIAANAVTAAKLAVGLTYRVCDIPIGDTSGSAIVTGQMGPQSRVCFIPATATIVEMDVNADAGTPNIIIGRNHAGTVTNIVSSALATAASGGIACSNTGGTTGINGATTCSATLQNTSLAAGDYIEAVSGTPGGTAKLFVAHIVYAIN